ncbi:type II toxin-antitoxin system RelE/ParE family toxin [Vibrio cholerae]|nr:type II toxin-antitoxin system RelE/ParE family toxin [Vibrio cholerae]
MIQSYKSKKLKHFSKGKVQAVDARHAKSIEIILNALDTATCVDDFDLHGRNLHSFNEKTPKVWSLNVSANWRITFEFDGSNIHNVDYLDTH